MIQLYDSFQSGSRDLHYSLQTAGFDGPAVVINDDGFLPDGVTSAYSYFCQMETGQGRPLYFNQLKVPAFWEISGNNGEAEVRDYGHLRAKIFYAKPGHLRLIKNVDWLDEDGKVRFTDHYNQYGWLFARTNFNPEQAATVRLYFNQAGQEVLVENFVTGDVILHWQGQDYFFENRIALFHFYFEVMGWDASQLWYNSLSTPFFMSYNSDQPGQDILFWQEPVGDEIPGNMAVMLRSDQTRTQRVVVQDRATYEKMLTLLPESQQHKITYLGQIYPERRAAGQGKEILILTNSDQIEQLDDVTDQMADYHFHIGALTEMSQRLMNFEDKDNVSLYPNISHPAIARLFEQCDIYLDINHGNEIVDAVRQAFEHNLLIVTFGLTAHKLGLTHRDHVFAAERPDELVAYLKEHEGNLQAVVDRQRQETNNESIARYQAVLG